MIHSHNIISARLGAPQCHERGEVKIRHKLINYIIAPPVERACGI